MRLAKKKIQIGLGDKVKILLAEDGLEAIETYKTLVSTDKQKYLCGIFMDYHMPNCSGPDAIRAIRHIERDSATKVSSSKAIKPCYIVAFTGDLGEASTSILKQAGSNEVMAKPTPSRQLEECCHRLVQSNSSVHI